MCDVLVRVLYCTILSVLPLANAETRVTGYKGLSGQRLTGQETFVPARSKIECAVICKKRYQCFSFLFDAATRTCHLQAVSEPGSGYDVQHVYVVKECDDGRYGTFCLNICSPYCNDVCNKLTGECGCKPGYMPTMCTQKCGNGRWGQNCSNICSSHCTNICNAVTGECTCNPGYQPPICVLGCSLGLYGQNCGLSCNSICSDCDKVTGSCVCNRAFVPTYTETNFRLACGSTSREGRLEININGTWGTVCDDDFYTSAAIVACRMMGYATTNPQVKHSAYFGKGEGTIHLDDVICSGNELSLLDCQHRPVDTHDCSHNEDVGVVC